jgi:hypothetical protein
MSKTKIFAILMWPVIGLLVYLLYDSINGRIEEAKIIANSEARVISQLKNIREAEKAFLIVNRRYTTNWDSLIAFVKSGELPIVQKVEKVTPRKRDDPEYYKGDIIEIRFDTIGKEPVLQKIFPADKYPGFNPDELPYVPGTDKKQFEIFADKVERGKVMVDVIEVVDPFPINKNRTRDNVNRTLQFLHFGSKTEPRINGNWE